MVKRVVAGGLGTLLLVGALVAPGLAADVITGMKPAEPQPQNPTPGLAVEYTYAIMNNISELKGRKYEAGPPLPNLDSKVGEGTVLTSKARDGVGATITGFIRFEKPGVYGFDVTSNDGVRVEIGGKLLYEDPGVHADDTSERIDVKIDQPGWYPIQVLYFEKRNTSTLILRWLGPGEKGKLQPVPAKAFGFVKK
jgi:hypothetical protein